MPTPAKGAIRIRNGVFETRITLQGKRRARFSLPTCRTQAEAEQRARLLAEQARRLRSAGHVGSAAGQALLDELARCRQGQVRDTLQVINELCGGIALPDEPKADRVTFRKVGEMWTSGELHRLYPDQIKQPKPESASLAAQRLERGVYPVIGSKPIDEVTRADCDEVMRALPVPYHKQKQGLSRQTRRAYAGLMTRVLNLAELCGFIQRSPLPRGWLPKPGGRKRYPILYPSEDRQLLECETIPLCYRLLWGFMHREGARRSEPAAMQVQDVDLEHETVTLDENKTDFPRWWKLSPGVAAALRSWLAWRGRHYGPVQPEDRLFIDEHGRPIVLDHLAEKARDHLREAELTRVDLFSVGPNKGHFGTHCFRRSFVTRSKANGQSDDWIRRRTGHTSEELQRYNQPAQNLAELDLGDIDPLIDSVPEFAIAPGLPTEPREPVKTPVARRNHVSRRFSPALRWVRPSSTG